MIPLLAYLFTGYDLNGPNVDRDIFATGGNFAVDVTLFQDENDGDDDDEITNTWLNRLLTSGMGLWRTDSTAITMALMKSSPPVPIAVNPLTVGYEFTCSIIQDHLAQIIKVR